MGEALARLGYHDLVAIDLSEGMLAEARKKSVYRENSTRWLWESL